MPCQFLEDGQNDHTFTLNTPDSEKLGKQFYISM